MKLTAYIPCFNVEAYVEASIRSLLAQSRPPDEILIIDDGSTDRTVEIASRFPVKIIRHDRNRGLAAVRNTALANATHELIGAIDADVSPATDWFEHLLGPFADPRVVATGGRLIEAFRDAPPDAWRAIHLCQDLGEHRIEMERPSHKCLGGFGTVLLKRVVQEVGGYDESFRTNFEDVDLCDRLKRAGHKLVFVPQAVAYHQRRDTTRSIIRTAWRSTFYDHYRHGAYNHLALKLLHNFRFGTALLWNHISAGRPALLPIDLLLPWVHSYMDLRYHFSSERLPKVVDPDPTQFAFYLPRLFRNSKKLNAREHSKEA